MRATLDLEPCPFEDEWALADVVDDGEPVVAEDLNRRPAALPLILGAVAVVLSAAALLAATGAWNRAVRPPPRPAASAPAVPGPAVPGATEVVVADHPGAASYSAQYGASYQPASGGYERVNATITRTSPGRYTVTFHALGAQDGAAASSTLAGSGNCVAPRWGAVGQDEVVDVWCDVGRTPTDREFFVSFSPADQT